MMSTKTLLTSECDNDNPGDLLFFAEMTTVRNEKIFEIIYTLGYGIIIFNNVTLFV